MKREELTDTLVIAIANALANTHTSTIGRVVSVGEKTVNIQPVINRVVDGESIQLPVFQDVPPIFLGGGASSLSFPIQAGDYALLIFTERCFDRWWNGQDEQAPLEMRMHDYSDGFALVGLKNEARALTIPSDMTFNGDLIIDGTLTVTGDVIATGDVVAGTVSLKNHTHSGVTTGAGISGPPVP